MSVFGSQQLVAHISTFLSYFDLQDYLAVNQKTVELGGQDWFWFRKVCRISFLSLADFAFLLQAQQLEGIHDPDDEPAASFYWFIIRKWNKKDWMIHLRTGKFILACLWCKQVHQIGGPGRFCCAWFKKYPVRHASCFLHFRKEDGTPDLALSSVRL